MRRGTRLGARSGFFAVAALAVGNTVGCDGLPSEVAPSSEDFLQRAASALDDAEAGGASQEQLALLESAAETGIVTVEQARTSARSYMACLDALGVDNEYDESSVSGLAIPGVNVLASTAPQMSIMEQCEVQENYWVNYLFQTQPSSEDITESYLRARQPALVACLAEAGVEIAEDEDMEISLRRASDLIQSGGVDCLAAAGIDGW